MRENTAHWKPGVFWHILSPCTTREAREVSIERGVGKYVRYTFGERERKLPLQEWKENRKYLTVKIRKEHFNPPALSNCHSIFAL